MAGIPIKNIIDRRLSEQEYLRRFHNEVNQFNEEMDEGYQKRMDQYNTHVANLKREKAEFIAANPDFPNVDLLFMNVIAPPQRIRITIIEQP